MLDSRTVIGPEQLELQAAAAISAGGSTGISVCAFENGANHVVAAGHASLEDGVQVTESTAFRVGCCIKLMTATLIMMLHEEGLLDIEAEVGQLIFGASKVPGAIHGVTILDLLRHTHGIDSADTNAQIDRSRIDQYEALDHDRLREEASTRSRLFEPGQHYSYSSFGYRLLGLVAESVTGTPYIDLLSQRIFRPLGISAATATSDASRIAHPYRPGKPGRPPSRIPYIDRYARGVCPARGASLALAPVDFMKFLMVHIDHRQPRLPGLSAHSIEDMQRRIFAREYMQEQFAGSGLSWRKINSSAYGLAGIGFGHHCILRIAPDRGIAIILMSNTAPAWPAYKRLFVDDVFQNNLEFRNRAITNEHAASSAPENYEAIFENDLGQIIIAQAADELIGRVQIRFASGYRPVLRSPIKQISPLGFQFETVPAGVNLRPSFWLTGQSPWWQSDALWDGLYYWKRMDASIEPSRLRRLV
jgi:CubicO group peptidase (beta-lactamase class C family)